MKNITLIMLVIISFMLFSGNKITPLNNEILEVETFSVEESLEAYIQISTPSVQVYYYTKKYCKEYNVPESVAFGVLKLETTYRGPHIYSYTPVQTSSGYARGPYQLLVSTARDMYVLLGLGERQELTAEMLLVDVELNVKLGVRYLRWLNDNISTNWTVSCGFYNTGYKIVNQYALNATRYM